MHSCRQIDVHCHKWFFLAMYISQLLLHQYSKCYFFHISIIFIVVKTANGGLHETTKLDTTGMITNLKPSIRPKWNTTDGNACSVWLPSSICHGDSHCILSDGDDFISAQTSNSLQSLRWISILSARERASASSTLNFWIPIGVDSQNLSSTPSQNDVERR